MTVMERSRITVLFHT